MSADDMLEVYSVNCVGPLLVVQQLLKAGLIGGPGGKTLVGNVSSKVGAGAGVAVGPGWRGTGCSSAAPFSVGQCTLFTARACARLSMHGFRRPEPTQHPCCSCSTVTIQPTRHPCTLLA